MFYKVKFFYEHRQNCFNVDVMKIAKLNLIQNKLDATNVDDIIGLLKAVKTQLDLAKSFDDGQGNFRDPSKSERIKILDVLDKMKDTV